MGSLRQLSGWGSHRGWEPYLDHQKTALLLRDRSQLRDQQCEAQDTPFLHRDPADRVFLHSKPLSPLRPKPPTLGMLVADAFILSGRCTGLML